MLVSLPSELLLDILKNLPVRDLATIQIVSRAFRSFVDTHEEAIYFHAAAYHRFIPANAIPDEKAQLTPTRVASLVRSWKYICMIWVSTEEGWNGRGLVIESVLPSMPDIPLYQLHVDEERKRLFALSVGGRLRIYSLRPGQRMESIGKMSDVMWMSVDEGWIATIASSGLLSMSMLHPIEGGGLTWSHHLELPQDLSFTFRDGSYQLRLPFLAAILQGPNSIRVAVWDAHTGQLKRLINPAEHLSDAWYNGHGFQNGAVRLTRSHVVVSLMTCVLVVPLSEFEDEEAAKRRFIFPSRSMGMDTPEVMLATAVRVVEDSLADSSPAVWGVPNSPAVCMAGSAAMTRMNLAPPMVILDTSSTSVVPWSDTMTEARFAFATVSPSGRHLAAVNEYGLLYIAADFDRVRQGLQSWEGITTKVILPPPAMHVIWEHEERLVVKAGGNLYVINLDPSFHNMPWAAAADEKPAAGLSLPSFKNLTIHRLNYLSDSQQRMLAGVSTQVTPHGIWTLSTANLWRRRVERAIASQSAMNERDGDGDALPTVVFVDFTKVALPDQILPSEDDEEGQ